MGRRAHAVVRRGDRRLLPLAYGLSLLTVKHCAQPLTGFVDPAGYRVDDKSHSLHPLGGGADGRDSHNPAERIQI
jgi:hypothetical protein